jgi:outer membrane protein TolC
VWDAGRTDAEVELEQAAAMIDQAAVDVDFHAWRERVEQAYFTVLASDAEARLQRLAIEDLDAQHRLADARVRAGVGLAGDRAAIAAEIELRGQRLDELETDRRAAVAFLAALTGVQLESDVTLQLPEVEVPSVATSSRLTARAAGGDGVERAELDQARGTQRLLQARYAASGLATKPLVAAFAQAGVGRPADQNFFERDLTPYVVAGVRVRWQPFDWGVTQREQEIRRLERDVAGARLETFLVSLSASLAGIAERIHAADAVLAADERILALRAEVSRQSAAQLRAGVITASAYLTERNAEFRAELARELHRLAQIRDIVAFHSTLGVPLDENLSSTP